MMSEVQAKIIAQVQDEFRLLREELRAGDALLEHLKDANRIRVERVARLEGLLVALSAFDSSAMVPLAKAPETNDIGAVSAEHGPDVVPVTPVPVTPVPTPPTEDDLLRQHPRLAEQKALASEAKRFRDEARTRGAQHAPKLDEAFVKLFESAKRLFQKLQDPNDPEAAFQVCGNNTMNALAKLIEGLMQGQGRSRGVASQTIIPEKIIHELKPFMNRIWRQVNACAPGLYEEFELQTGIIPTSQKPVSVLEEKYLFDIYCHEPSTAVSKNEVVSTVIPGYCEVKRSGSKSLISPAWVIISVG